MSRVVVVGGGFAGISAAIRIAKLGHAVTLLEQSESVGGRMRPTVVEGFTFDHGAGALTLPATLRDLFRKSGRPLERVLDLHHVDPGRRHVFADGAVLDLPCGSRAAQSDALADVVDAPRRWSQWLDSFDETWEVVRRQTLDVEVQGRDSLSRAQWRTLRPRRTLRKEVRSRLSDKRLRAVAVDRFRLAGHDPRAVPAFAAVCHLVERTFGRWQIDGGSAALREALVRRLEERRVTVRTQTFAGGLVERAGTVRGVLVDGGSVDADIVVWAAPSDPEPTTRPAAGLLPAVPPARTYLGLRSGAPGTDTVAETMVHCDPPVRILPSGSHVGPGHAWTVEHHASEDPLAALARAGVDVRPYVVTRKDEGAAEQVRAHGPAFGWRWSGPRTALERPLLRSGPVGLLRVGVNTHPGTSTELIAAGTAVAAATIGKA